MVWRAFTIRLIILYNGRGDKMEIYFAGDGFPQSCAYIYGQGYNRLLSYINNRQRAEKYIYSIKGGITL